MTEIKLPKFSYSKLDTFSQCPMKYKHKYVDGNYGSSDAVHLDLGNILHKVLEIKYRNIMNGKENDYAYLKSVLKNGIAEETDKDKGDFIPGTDLIKEKFGRILFSEINRKSNMSYEDKLKIFDSYLIEDNLENGWKTIAVELSFEFVYDDKVILHGFIDRIDQNEKGELRVVDYKSSNKIFSKEDLPTPLQMFIYALACEKIYGKRPVEYLYDMILLGEKQLACTKGYYNRGIKKLNGILDKIRLAELTGIYKPNPTPLCYWCDFSETNPNSPFFLQGLCDYYSLWKPEKKYFNVNKKFEEEIIDF